MQNVEIGVVWEVKGHPKLPVMSSYYTAHMTSYLTLIETMCLSCTVFELQQVICQKSQILCNPLHLAPPLRVTLFKIRQDLWHQKTRVPALSCGIACVIMCLAILIQYWHVMDRWTDRRTDTR